MEDVAGHVVSDEASLGTALPSACTARRALSASRSRADDLVPEAVIDRGEIDLALAAGPVLGDVDQLRRHPWYGRIAFLPLRPWGLPNADHQPFAEHS